MKAPLPKAVLLAALNARPYAYALQKAGYHVVVIDGFLDQETRFFADNAIQVDFDEKGFIASQFEDAIKDLIPQYNWIGCVFGAGFESRPALLKVIGEYMPLLGNTYKTYEAVNQPHHFFQTCDQLSIPIPAWQLQPPSQLGGRWLKKRIGGAGGGHIQFAKPSEKVDETLYFQRSIDGESVSVLFMALPQSLGLDTNALMLGAHLQWASASPAQPLRLGGLVALDDLDEDVTITLKNTIQKLTHNFGLVGLNSLDVILQGSKVFVLELNPRLSLSLDLYLQDYIGHTQVNLLSLHLRLGLFVHQHDGMLKQEILHAIKKLMAYDVRLTLNRVFRAIAVVYALGSVDVKENTQWPEWVVDRPAKAERIESDQPVCSVLASASSTQLAWALVLKRVQEIKQMLNESAATNKSGEV